MLGGGKLEAKVNLHNLNLLSYNALLKILSNFFFKHKANRIYFKSKFYC